MRYLGIDYGNKRIGIAISDEGCRIAFPREVVVHLGKRRFISYLRNFIEKEDVNQIVIGLPVGLDGKDTLQTREVRNFARFIEDELNITVVFENEMLTTKIAKNRGVKKNHVDAAAAAVILQSYLDRGHL